MFFFSSRRRHTRCALVTGVQTCALPICFDPSLTLSLGARVIHDKKTINNISTCIQNPAVPVPDLCGFLGTAVYPGALAFNRTYQGEISKWSWSGRAVLQYQPTRDRKSTRLNSSH